MITEPRPTVLLGGSALLGPELDEVSDVAITISGTEIVAAGHRRDLELPPNAETVELEQSTLIPGFIDAHVHIGFADPRDVLVRGVTAVRDLAWPPEHIYPLAARSREREFDGPLVTTVGPMLTVAGGYPITAGWAPSGTGLALESPSHAREVVERLVSEDVSAIKIALNPPAGNVMSDDVLAAVVDRAHELGKTVTAHVHGLDQLERALGARVDELAHMLLSREAIPDDLIVRMVEQRMVVVPTLSIFPRSDTRVAIENLRRFLEAGGRVVYGTDLGNQGPRPGIDRTEVERMQSAGMTTKDIVRAATVDAAGWLRLERKGSIAPGMDADVIAVRAPVERAKDLCDVNFVMREGRALAS